MDLSTPAGSPALPLPPVETDSAPRRGSGITARGVLLVFAIWTLLGVLAAMQRGLDRLYRGEPAEWGLVFASSLADWYTCAAFTPVVLWLVRRHPLRRRGLARTLAFYTLVTAAMTVMKYALYVPLRRAIGPEWNQPLGAVLAGRFYFEFLAFGSVVAIALALEYYRSWRDRELRASQLEAQLSRAQLDALRGQLRPHFLFNTMNGISTLMYRDVEAADEMLTQLCDLLRLTLEREGVQEVALADELEVLQRYVAIMKIRFSDRLTVDVDVDPAALELAVPHFILQPLVENAIEHGIAADPAAGRIWITAERAEGRLRITIADDGPGLHATESAAVREGVGLSNTRGRLRQLYGDEGRLELHRRAPRGTVVTLELPAHVAPRLDARAAVPA